jgi:two-component system, sensor histidine kinase LadS
MTKKKAYLFCLFFYSGIMVAFAADTLDDRRLERGPAVSLTPYSEWFEDTTRTLTAADLLRHPEWFQSPAGFHQRSRTGIYWVKTAVVNREPVPLNIVVSFSNLSFVDVYVGGQHRRAGTFRPAREIQAGDGREWVTLSIPPHTGYTLLLRVYHTKHYWPDLTFYVRQEVPFREALYMHRMIDALFLGAIAILFLYSLLSWLISAYRPYLWLMLFIGAEGMYSLSVGGYFIDWLTPEAPLTGWLWNIHLIHIATIGALILLVDFWQVRSRWPSLFRLFRWMIAGLAALSLISFLIDYFTSNFAGMNGLNLLVMSGCVLATAYAMTVVWRQLRRPERILGAGYIVYLTAYLTSIVLWLVLHERALAITAYLSNIAMLCVILLFSIALKEELRQYEQDKNRALLQLNDLRQQQNLMLEELVQERTRDLKQSNEALMQNQSELKDRNQRIETLIQEVQHRVKNNLQLLYGLIQLQLPDIDDMQAKDMLKKNLNRIRAMSIVNEKLYGSDDVTLILLKDFIRETAAHVAMMYDGDHEKEMKYDIEEDIAVSPHFAIPFGLILTELLTNTFKYAIPGQGPIRIGIAIHKAESESRQVQFDYRDNGSAPAADTEMSPGKSFSGLTLVRDLVRQLHGRMESWQEGGWCYRIWAPVDRR